jgi:hypothetical protein
MWAAGDYPVIARMLGVAHSRNVLPGIGALIARNDV